MRRTVLRFRHVDDHVTRADVAGVTLSFGRLRGLRRSGSGAVVLFDTAAAAHAAAAVLNEHRGLLQRRLGARVTVDAEVVGTA